MFYLSPLIIALVSTIACGLWSRRYRRIVSPIALIFIPTLVAAFIVVAFTISVFVRQTMFPQTEEILSPQVILLLGFLYSFFFAAIQMMVSSILAIPFTFLLEKWTGIGATKPVEPTGTSSLP